MSDAVLILTGGSPKRQRDENTFGDKYKNDDGELLLAKERAKSLRDKDVAVFGISMETESNITKIQNYIKGWSTEGKYIEKKRDWLQSVVFALFPISCTTCSSKWSPANYWVSLQVSKHVDKVEENQNKHITATDACHISIGIRLDINYGRTKVYLKECASVFVNL